MITYPNQKIIHINKPVYTGDYLSVGNSEWAAASNDLTYNAFKLYLYLSGNADGFDLALSKKAVQNIIRMSDNTYSNVVKELTEKNYILPDKGNLYDFYTIPQSNGITKSSGGEYPNVMVDNTPVEYDIIPHSDGREISNITNKNNLSKEATAKKERDRALESLDDEELKSIISDFSKKVNYKTTRERLKLNRQVTKDTWKEAETILSQRMTLAKNAEIEAQFFSISAEDISRISDYLGCANSEVKSNLSYLGVNAQYFLDWLTDLDGERARLFSRTGNIWVQAEKDRIWDNYLKFLKMQIEGNPVAG